MSASGEGKWRGQVERTGKKHLADAETVQLLVDANGRSSQVWVPGKVLTQRRHQIEVFGGLRVVVFEPRDVLQRGHVLHE